MQCAPVSAANANSTVADQATVSARGAGETRARFPARRRRLVSWWGEHRGRSEMKHTATRVRCLDKSEVREGSLAADSSARLSFPVGGVLQDGAVFSGGNPVLLRLAHAGASSTTALHVASRPAACPFGPVPQRQRSARAALERDDPSEACNRSWPRDRGPWYRGSRWFDSSLGRL